jgi:Ca2+-binding EF-hand superfamily protein
LKDIDNFCNSGTNSEKYLKEMNQQQTVALRNLKAVCSNRHIDLFNLLSKYDNNRNGMIPLEKFKDVVKKLIDSSQSLMAIVKLVQKGAMNQIDINLLQLYLNKAEDPSKFAYMELLREFIVSAAVQQQIWLKKMFEKYSKDKIMLLDQFKQLMIECGMKVPDTKKMEELMHDFHPTSQVPYMTVYDFLSIFQRSAIETELMEMFKPFAVVYSNLKEKTDLLGNTISKHFYTVTSTAQLSFEIIKLLNLPEGSKEAIGFSAMFEDRSQRQLQVLDKKALEFVETYLPKNLKSIVSAEQPQAQRNQEKSILPADPSGLTLEELEKAKVGITQIDALMRKTLNQDYINALKKYDTLNTGKISDQDFFKFLEQDLKLNASKKKNTIDMLSRYSKQGKQGQMDYHHLWKLISTDLAAKKSEKSQDFKIESNIGDQAAPAIPTHLRTDKKDNLQPGDPLLMGDMLDTVKNNPISKQLLLTFRQLGVSKDNFMNLLFPDSVRELEKDKMIKNIMDLVKDLNSADVEKYLGLANILKDEKYAQKDRFRSSLFDELNMNTDLKDQTMDQQIQFVYDSFRTGKDGLTMNQVGDACKRLGIYLSKPELDQLYRDFKRKDASDMSEADFNKLIKHEFSKDIISSRILAPRLTKLLDSVLMKREDNIIHSQVK